MWICCNSRLSLSARSTTQSIPGIRSDYNVVESYGHALPVAVNEALTFAGPNANAVSAKITQSGWAWVCFHLLYEIYINIS